MIRWNHYISYEMSYYIQTFWANYNYEEVKKITVPHQVDPYSISRFEEYEIFHLWKESFELDK